MRFLSVWQIPPCTKPISCRGGILGEPNFCGQNTYAGHLLTVARLQNEVGRKISFEEVFLEYFDTKMLRGILHSVRIHAAPVSGAPAKNTGKYSWAELFMGVVSCQGVSRSADLYHAVLSGLGHFTDCIFRELLSVFFARVDGQQKLWPDYFG